ncbi:MAG: hypothetical protein ABSG34_17970 [Candidatus Sulfotelmatobacter sp.]|jgi:hypothetical protein
MLEAEPEKPSRSTIQVFLGFLLGVLGSLVFLFFAIPLGGIFGSGHTWLFPVFNAIGLIVAIVIALREVRESSYALGFVIALSLALLLDGACAVAFLK